jgi:hypothetical protein
MFAMSVKSVPGCLVLIEPRLIGVPVAAWPGFDPHDDVLLEPLLALVEVAELDVPLGAALEVLVELLLPQAASAAAPTNATIAMTIRRRIGTRPGRRPSLPHVNISAPLSFDRSVLSDTARGRPCRPGGTHAL